MGNALFYHLTRSPAEALLPVLLRKALAAGWRVELRGTAPARMAALDEQLWLGEGFLPHGLAGGAQDARQPVLLSVADAGASDRPAANDAACLMAIDGSPVSAAECAARERVCILFDGHDPAALDQARGQWRALTGAGVTAEYWSEADGRWQRKQ